MVWSRSFLADDLLQTDGSELIKKSVPEKGHYQERMLDICGCNKSGCPEKQSKFQNADVGFRPL